MSDFFSNWHDGGETPDEMGGGAPTRNGSATADRAAAALIAPAHASHIDVPRSAALERYASERFARTVRLRGSALAPASGFAWINLYGPSDGFVWNVRRLNVGPYDYTSLPYATGTITLAVILGQQQPPAGSVSADVVVSVDTAWPAEGTWGPGELTIEGGDYLWLGVSGVASGATITAGGQASQTAARVAEIYGL